MRLPLTILALSLCLPMLCGCNGGSGPALPQVEPEAARILKESDAFYRRQTGYSAIGRLEARLHDRSGDVVKSMDPLNEDRQIVVRGQNEYLLSGKEFRIACNGKTMYLSPGTGKIYWKTEALKSPMTLAETPLAPLFGGPDNILAIGLLNPGLEAALQVEGHSLTYVEQTEIDGKAAHHLSIQEPVGDSNPHPVGQTEIWIAVEGDPVILQLRQTPVPRVMNFGRQQIEGAIVSVETLSDWKFGEDAVADEFTFPAGARRVPGLGQIVRGESALVGTPAVEAVLQLLDGSTVSLSELRAQEKIVILDFWATWCGPCRQELPFVTKLAAEFADQGVVFYGVNQGESGEQVRAFQSQVDYKFTAALDPAGVLSDQFGANSLPYLCIIGRDGTIQVIHVGVGADTESSIREELAALVSGRNLATEGLPE